MMSLKTSATTLVENARARIEGIETSEAINMMNDPDVIIVDIRDIRERQRSGHIPGSFHALRGMIEPCVDPDSPFFKEIFGKSDKKIFHCASGWRSALTVATLQDMGFQAAHMRDGSQIGLPRVDRQSMTYQIVEKPNEGRHIATSHHRTIF
jgi:rhodanese-related sulfurtransferase